MGYRGGDGLGQRDDFDIRHVMRQTSWQVVDFDDYLFFVGMICVIGDAYFELAASTFIRFRYHLQNG